MRYGLYVRRRGADKGRKLVLATNDVETVIAAHDSVRAKFPGLISFTDSARGEDLTGVVVR